MTKRPWLRSNPGVMTCHNRPMVSGGGGGHVIVIACATRVISELSRCLPMASFACTKTRSPALTNRAIDKATIPRALSVALSKSVAICASASV